MGCKSLKNYVMHQGLYFNSLTALDTNSTTMEIGSPHSEMRSQAYTHHPLKYTHLHEGEAERVPAAPQQSLTLGQRFVIQSYSIYLGRENIEQHMKEKKQAADFLTISSHIYWGERRRCTFLHALLVRLCPFNIRRYDLPVIKDETAYSAKHRWCLNDVQIIFQERSCKSDPFATNGFA